MTPDLSELVLIERADVYKRGVPAATLTRLAHGIELRYLPSYLDVGGSAIATTLPVTTEPLVTPAGALPPYFSGLLPEGRRLTALRRRIKTSPDDDLSLLLAVGADVIGDIQVVPEGTRPIEVPPVVEVSKFDDVSFADLFRRSIGEEPDLVSLPGVQEKVSARMINLPLASPSGQFILKLNPPEFPHLVENEAFFLEAARSSGLNTVETQLVRDRDAAPGLLVRRFDRITGPRGTIGLAVEDACQVLGRHPAQKYAMTTEDVIRSLSAITLAGPVAARDLLRQFAFAYLTGNGDAHAKNFSIVQRIDGEWRVAPAYDLPCSYPYGDTTLALSVRGHRRDDVTRSTFLELGAVVGVNTRAVTRILDDLVQRSELWLPRLDELPFDARQVHKLRRFLEMRRRRLIGA